MTIDTLNFEHGQWQLQPHNECKPDAVDIVFVFADIDIIREFDHVSLLKQTYPNAHIVGTSTAGNILNDTVSEHQGVATAVSFEQGHVAIRSVNALKNERLYETAQELAKSLPKEDLRHVFVMADGLKINGSQLVKGLNSVLDVSVTGGLAGDDLSFKQTLVFADGDPQESAAVIIGFYGESLHVSVGCKAGWEEFGAERIVTKAEGNVIYEIDNKPAIELYEAYLGDYIKDLPASGLLFPLNIKEYEKDKEVIRVMMGINEDRSIIFAGDIPQGSTVRLMKTNVDNLIDGSSLVAHTIQPYNDKRSLTLTVSCSGRRSVLKQLVDEEIDAVHSILGKRSQIVGFYSFGEIAPFSDDILECKLHNQTMTLTSIYEE